MNCIVAVTARCVFSLLINNSKSLNVYQESSIVHRNNSFLDSTRGNVVILMSIYVWQTAIVLIGYGYTRIYCELPGVDIVTVFVIC